VRVIKKCFEFEYSLHFKILKYLLEFEVQISGNFALLDFPI